MMTQNGMKNEFWGRHAGYRTAPQQMALNALISVTSFVLLVKQPNLYKYIQIV